MAESPSAPSLRNARRSSGVDRRVFDIVGRVVQRRVPLTTRKSRTSNSSPDPLRPSLGTKQQAPLARRFNHIGPLSTPTQKLRANWELWKDKSPDTSVTQTLVSGMAAEIDMEDAVAGHNLASFSYDDKPLDLITMEQFELEYPYTPPPPPPPRRTTEPLRSTSQNGQFTGEFQLACDARGIKHNFSYRTIAQGCFEVELRLNGEFVDRIGQDKPYASKKDAKEEICKKHLATVELMPNLKKRKATEADCCPLPAGIDDELWVNLVHEYTQKHQLPLPDFEYQTIGAALGPWTCLLRVKDAPLTPFGGHHKPYMTKMGAKKAAAMEAVKWLRSATKMAPASDKRRKASATSVNGLASALSSSQTSETGLTQVLQSVDVNASIGSYSDQVHRLALELGFSQPAYKHIPVPNTDAFYNSYAQFNEKDARKDPRLAGPVGPTLHVYGRKAAQQACAAQVLIVLDAIRRGRIMH